MIEIAISLAIIGFALVAIIGILPTGMNVQKENRQETIINQDVGIWMEAIRNGAQGMDYLTNYVWAITNFQTAYNLNGGRQGNTVARGYTYTNAFLNFRLNSGFRIVGLLSTPRFVQEGKTIYSNYVVAYVRSMSGPAQEKFPQNNPEVLDLAFQYRFSTEIVPHTAFDHDWTNYQAYLGSTVPYDWQWRSNYWRLARTIQNSFYDVRLLFRWPLLPNHDVGNNRQIFRTMASGYLSATNEIGFPTNIYFFQPRIYVQAP
jgi:hypothetical protein